MFYNRSVHLIKRGGDIVIDNKIRYSGKTIFYEKETMFDFDGLFLNLYVDSDIYKSLTTKVNGNGILTSELQELSVNYLDCEINGSSNRVLFSFDKNISKCNSQNFQVFTISLFVHNYVEYVKYIPSLKNTDYVMTYYSKDLMKYLHLTPFYNVAFEKENQIATVNLDSSSCDKISYSNILGYDIEINPTYRKQWCGCNFDFTPGLQLKVKNAPNFDYDMQFKFYHSFIKLLKYMFMRDNMMPELMEFYYSDTKGNINSNYYNIQEKDIENANDVYSSCIFWDTFYPVAGNVLKAITEDNIFLNNIPKKRIDRISVNDVSISKDAAEFEYEFKVAYPNGVPHSEKRIEIENIVKNKLEVLKNESSGIEKDYYKKFIKHVKQESLSGNMQYVFETFDDVLFQFKNKLKLTMNYKDIAEECSGIRNTIDHGKNDREITSDTAACYVLLRTLIYCIQLRRLGLDDDNIKASIMSLYRIKELGGLML